MKSFLNGIGKKFFNFFSSIKISNIIGLVFELVEALNDGKISEKEKADLIKRAKQLLTDLDENSEFK